MKAFSSRISDLAVKSCLLGPVPPQNRSKPGIFSPIARKKNDRARFLKRGLVRAGHQIWPNFEKQFPNVYDF